MNKILITGGGGYLGSILTPYLLEIGYEIIVLDSFWYGNYLNKHPNLEIVYGDLRNCELVDSILKRVDMVIHLACLSNDPCAEIDEDLTKQINYDASVELIKLSKKNKIKRFIYASSSSVYGIKDEPEVVETLSLEPISLYSKLKVEVEKVLFDNISDSFIGTAVRSATLCGYSPRMRFDLLVNILTATATTKGKLFIEGGQQVRANIHVNDISRFYHLLLEIGKDKINGEAFNVKDENYKVIDMAKKVQRIIPAEIEFVEKIDNRSYSLSDKKAREKLGFTLKYSIDQAIMDVFSAIKNKKANPDSISTYNIKTLKSIGLENLKWKGDNL